MVSSRQLILVATVGLLGTATAVASVVPTSSRAQAVGGPFGVVQAPAVRGGQPISSRDRVYTADMASNTVSVIDPKTETVLGTIPLGQAGLGQILGPVDTSQVGVHGLGFSRDGRHLDVISVNSNAAQLINPQSNVVATTSY